MGTEYRVCIVGCGRMGGTIDEEVRATPHGALPYSHAAGYTAFERTDLVAAADVVEEKAQYVCNKWDIPKYYLDYRGNDPPRETGYCEYRYTSGQPCRDYSEFAAENGVKGIYCDKPLCASMEEADAMVAVCEQYNIKFNLGTQRRYTPGYIKMRELLESGELRG